jgi:hypothetical protein
MSPELVLLMLIFLVMLITSFLVIPIEKYSHFFDRITRGKLRKDHETLKMAIDHLKNYPEEWSISRTSVNFPKEGLKRIVFNLDRSTGWEYNMPAFGNFRPLNGHFEACLEEIIKKECSIQEREALFRAFHPELNNLLLTKRA